MAETTFVDELTPEFLSRYEFETGKLQDVFDEKRQAAQAEAGGRGVIGGSNIAFRTGEFDTQQAREQARIMSNLLSEQAATEREQERFDIETALRERELGISESQLSQQASQFAQQFGLNEQQLAEQIRAAQAGESFQGQQLSQQASQFAQQLGLSQDQFAFQKEMSALDEAFRQAQLAQQGEQFAQQFGLNEQQLAEQIRSNQASEDFQTAQLAQQQAQFQSQFGLQERQLEQQGAQAIGGGVTDLLNLLLGGGKGGSLLDFFNQAGGKGTPGGVNLNPFDEQSIPRQVLGGAGEVAGAGLGLLGDLLPVATPAAVAEIFAKGIGNIFFPEGGRKSKEEKYKIIEASAPIDQGNTLRSELRHGNPGDYPVIGKVNNDEAMLLRTVSQKGLVITGDDFKNALEKIRAKNYTFQDFSKLISDLS